MPIAASPGPAGRGGRHRGRPLLAHKGVDLRAVACGPLRQRRGGRDRGGRLDHHPAVREERAARPRARRAPQAPGGRRSPTSSSSKYSKERILELYLNTIYFGNGAYGVQAARRRSTSATGGRQPRRSPRPRCWPGSSRPRSASTRTTHPTAAGARRQRGARPAWSSSTWSRAGPGRRGPALSRSASAKPPAGERYPAALLRRAGEAVRPRRPPVRRHPGRAPPAAVRAAGCGSTPPSTSSVQAKAEDGGGQGAVPPDKDPAGRGGRHRPGHRLRAGPRRRAGTSSAAAPRPSSTWPPRAGPAAGSSFKPLVLAAALDEGHPARPGLRRRPRRLTIPLPRQEAWEVENYEGTGGGRMNLVEATGQLRQHGLRPAHHGRRPRGGHGAWPQAWASRRRSSRSPSAVLGTNEVQPARHGLGLRAPSADRGLAVPPTLRHPRCWPSPAGPLPAPPHAAAGASKPDIADAEVTPCCARSSTGHRRQRPHRPAGGGQDRHRPAVAGRLVRRLHARPGDGGVGGLPRRADLDGAAGDPHPGDAAGRGRPRSGSCSWARRWPSTPVSDFPPAAAGRSSRRRHQPPVPGPQRGRDAESTRPRRALAARRLPAPCASCGPSDDYPPGYVVDQAPAAGHATRRVARRSPSSSATGAAPASVPDVLGRTEADGR